jgi:hypothetical protein
MEPLSKEDLLRITSAHEIEYEALEDKNPLIVRTRMARSFPLSQESVFDAFSDPVSHVGLFPIIKGSTAPIRRGIEGMLDENQFFVFEQVQESTLPPRIMLIKYTLERPNKIIKEGVTDPFLISEGVARDRKRAAVTMNFDKQSNDETKIRVESSFETTTGEVFSRGFIDRVWLAFFENMMVANGQLNDGNRLV